MASEEPAKLTTRHLAAVGVGNALAFYDFLTYAFFAIQIGHTFFPSKDQTFSLLASLATFGVGFFARPVGGIVIGAMGDRIGRKPAMILSFSLMGVGILGLALTPGYRSIGIAAPILLIVFRMVQGFALGGEVGPSTSLLIEAAPPERRGRYTAIAFATQDLGVLVSGIVGTVLASTLSTTALDDWGWRIAFLIGVVIVPFGLLIRRGLPETLEEKKPHEAPVALRPFLVPALLGVLMLGMGSIATYELDYITTYASNILHMSMVVAFGATVVTGVVGIAGDMGAGILSDRFGRRLPALFGFGLLTAFAVPAFLLMVHVRSASALYVATTALVIFQCLASAPVLIVVTEALPARIRSGSLSLIYALAVAVFGGGTQFAVTWLIKVTGSPFAPAWYLTGAAIVGFGAMLLTEETHPFRKRAQVSEPAVARAAAESA